MNIRTLLFYIILITLFPAFLSGKMKVKVLTSEYIFKDPPFSECHASTILETKDGLMAAWFGGTYERHPDVCIYTSIYKDNEWSKPQLAADGMIDSNLRYPCWNPVLYRLSNGKIVLHYKTGPSPTEWWALYKTSDDEGQTWSKEIKLPDGYLGPIKNKPEQLKNGTILYPTSFEDKEKWNVYVEYSDEKLQNWKKKNIDNNGFNAIQPTILSYRDGKIQMLCRCKEGRIVETWSENGGKNWTPLKATVLPNNNSGIDGVTHTNGFQLLVYNPIVEGRNKLSVAISYDGKSWEELLILEDQPEGEFSYPAVICNKDGSIHITYTYNRVDIKHVHLVMEP